MMRRSLKELYGLEGGLGEQYLSFWRRIVGRRLRAIALGLPDAGCDPDRPRAAVDGGAAGDLDRC